MEGSFLVLFVNCCTGDAFWGSRRGVLFFLSFPCIWAERDLSPHPPFHRKRRFFWRPCGSPLPLCDVLGQDGPALFYAVAQRGLSKVWAYRWKSLPPASRPVGAPGSHPSCPVPPPPGLQADRSPRSCACGDVRCQTGPFPPKEQEGFLPAHSNPAPKTAAV